MPMMITNAPARAPEKVAERGSARRSGQAERRLPPAPKGAYGLTRRTMVRVREVMTELAARQHDADMVSVFARIFDDRSVYEEVQGLDHEVWARFVARRWTAALEAAVRKRLGFSPIAVAPGIRWPNAPSWAQRASGRHGEITTRLEGLGDYWVCPRD